MRIAFFVNSIKGEYPHYTTTVLALSALGRGHEIVYVTPADFVLRPDDSLMVRALCLPNASYKKPETLHKNLQGKETEVRTIDVREIDVIFLRNDPSLDFAERPWAAHVGAMFGRLAAERGVLVVNDPDGLALAQSKLYFQSFPESVRPAALISKSIEEIRSFIEQQPQGAIVKPLQGSGGKNVFKIDSPQDANLNQIFEAVSEEGYLIAQAYIAEAKAGDVRLFMMNGRPLERDGKYAAFRRVPAKGELRSNLHVAGTAVKVKVTDQMLSMADIVRPKLVQDGMFLVGLDIVGDKILEINVFTPGGMWSMTEMYKTDFLESVIIALETKLALRGAYASSVSNLELATL